MSSSSAASALQRVGGGGWGVGGVGGGEGWVLQSRLQPFARSPAFVSNATLGTFPRDGVERIWAFPSA